MVLPRRIEEQMLKLLRQGKISKWFSGIGQEAGSVGATSALRDDDVIFPSHRNLGVFTTRELDLVELFRQLLGRSGSLTDARDRTFHFGAPKHNIIGTISHLAAMLPVADGAALAFQLRQEDRVSLVFFGDGASSEGDFHEALNLAAVWKLPVVFYLENNGWALSTPTRDQFACERLADRAAGYGMPGVRIDGNDVLAVGSAVTDAADLARCGGGPTLIEAMTYRMRGHEEASGTAYVPPEELEAWAKRDPIATFEERLKGAGDLDDLMIDSIGSEIDSEIRATLSIALETAAPQSTPEFEIERVFVNVQRPLRRPAAQTSEMRYLDAISDAIDLKLATDDSIVIMGQDIGEYGGVFKATAGHIDRHGADRVRGTPVIESGIVGAALGLALEGFKPIVEMQFGDFVSCAFNQIVNNVAKVHYRWGGNANVTIRMPIGGGMGAGPFHSQSPEAWFCHVPGLKVVIAATPADAKGLLIAAIDDPNPVLFMEHKALYRSLKADVPTGIYDVEIGKARIVRQGNDATIVTWGLGVRWAIDAADELVPDGASVEIIDLRSLVPWDREAVLSSVARTGRVLVLHEANQTSGFGGEIAATIAQEAFWDLDAPVYRSASIDTPIPYHSGLERDVYFPLGRLENDLRALLET